MKKLLAFLNTPLGVVIVVGVVMLGVELLIMALLHIFEMQFKLSVTAWNVIDAITLTAILSPALYFLVFRKMIESEERFRQINATAPDAIVIINAQSEIIEWNLAAQRMFQYSREEAVGQQMHQLIIPPRYRDDAAHGFARFEEAGNGPLIGKTTEISGLRKDGSEFPVELSISAVNLKGRWHAIGIIHDITERERAEELLNAQLVGIQRARLEWQAVFDSISQPIFLHDGEFRVTRANLAYAKTAGMDIHDVIGRPYWKVFPRGEGPMASCTQAQRTHKEESEEFNTDGEIYLSRAFLAENFPGKQYAVHILENITERKQIEATQRFLAESGYAQGKEKNFFQLLARYLAQTLKMDYVCIDRLEGDQLSARTVAVYCDGEFEDNVSYTLKDTPCGEVVAKKVCCFTQDVRQLFPQDAALQKLLAESYAGTTLFGLDGKPIGLIAVIGRQPLVNPRLAELLLQMVSARAVGELERQQAQETIIQSQQRLSAALEDAIGAIAATLEQRDPYTAGHQRRVAELAAAIGEEMGLAREALEGIHFGGLIHDIGKISVPAEVLNKPGRIIDIEFDLIKSHAEAGYQIVKEIAFPWPVADMVRQHHERLDGSGYPQGLKGEQITLEARILAVADVVEAMSSDRPYRPGLGMDAALGEITRGRGTQFDPVAVDACLRVIKEQGFVFTK